MVTPDNAGRGFDLKHHTPDNDALQRIRQSESGAQAGQISMMRKWYGLVLVGICFLGVNGLNEDETVSEAEERIDLEGEGVPEEIEGLNERTFLTKPHYRVRHRPYYVLRTTVKGQDDKRQGVWYPTFPVGGGSQRDPVRRK